VVSVTFPPLYPLGQISWYPLEKYPRYVEDKNALPGIWAPSSDSQISTFLIKPHAWAYGLCFIFLGFNFKQQIYYVRTGLVSRVTMQWAEKSENRGSITDGGTDLSLRHRGQTGDGVQPVYLIDTGSSFPGSKADGVWSWPLTILLCPIFWLQFKSSTDILHEIMSINNFCVDESAAEYYCMT
jgi:hypothetical protein